MSRVMGGCSAPIVGVVLAVSAFGEGNGAVGPVGRTRGSLWFGLVVAVVHREAVAFLRRKSHAFLRPRPFAFTLEALSDLRDRGHLTGWEHQRLRRESIEGAGPAGA